MEDGAELCDELAVPPCEEDGPAIELGQEEPSKRDVYEGYIFRFFSSDQ